MKPGPFATARGRPRPTSILVAAIALALLVLTACSGSESAAPTPASSPTTTAQPTATPVDRNYTFSMLWALPAGYRIQTLLDGLDQPTAIAATPDGRLLITEQVTGRVRVVQDGVLLADPWFELPVRYADAFIQELGLVTIAVDPRFEENHYVYIYYTESREGGGRSVFARLRDVNGHGQDLTELVSIDLAPERTHVAGGIAFLGDAILLGIGDHEHAELSRLPSSPVGKILRIDRDGNPLPDNPFVGVEGADPRVYALGMRNPFGIAVDPVSGRALFTENRDAEGDAVYELEAGVDYGWPDYVVLREPLVVYERPMGIAGAWLYRGTALPEFDGSLFFCHFHGGGALHWSDVGPLTGTDVYKRDRIIGPGCSTGVTQGADGFLYYLTYGGELLRISR